jgi:dihydrofolate synthase/folylpolyglutamate synthase
MMGFYPRTHALFGMLRDKDIAGVVDKVRDKIDHWYVAPTPGARGTAAADIARHIRAIPGASVTEYQSFAAAFASAREHATPDDRILAFGSFLSVAEVLRAIGEMNKPNETKASHACGFVG